MDIQSFSQNEQTKRDIKVIVVDVDGTLLNSNHVLSDRNRETIRKAIDSGIQVVLATGKTRAGAESVIAALNLQTPGVFVQGLLIYNGDGTIRHQQTIDDATVRRVIQYAEASGFSVVIYSGNRLLVKANEPLVDAIADYHEPMPQAVGNLVNIVGEVPAHKLFIVGGTPRKIKKLRWQLNQQVGTQVSFTTTAMLDSLEVLPKGASKGNGVRVLLKEMHVSPEQVMAIGDAENDLEMLQLAGLGLGVAVGNATDALKEVAHEVVATNDEHGVAEAIERFVLRPQAEANKDSAHVTGTPEETESEASQST